jgi:hypothetical protein
VEIGGVVDSVEEVEPLGVALFAWFQVAEVVAFVADGLAYSSKVEVVAWMVGMSAQSVVVDGP